VDDGDGLTDISFVEQASKIGIPRVARTIGLQAVLRKVLLFFILIFV
jgi:hypothetical protein